MLKHPFRSLDGVVASEHPLASLIGSRVIERGNAVDAAVSTSLTLSVTLPHLGGLGGDFFALIKDPEGKVFFVDGAGFSPKALSRELMLEKGFRNMPSHGPLAITVPGIVDGLRVMWERFGSLEWADLVMEVERVAREGFPVSGSLASSVELLRSSLSRDEGSAYTYLKTPISEGSVVRFPGLSRALQLIAEDPRSFYEGDIAERISTYIRKAGGVIEPDDFRVFKASLGEPLKGSYRGRAVYEMPPPTQGVTTLHILKLLEQIDLLRFRPESRERVETLLKAAIPSYRARDSYVTNPDHMEVSVEELLSKEFIRRLREEFNGASPDSLGCVGGGGDTTFFAVADKEGFLVAGIQSLFYPFGSYVTEPHYGITLNSRASSFSLDPRHVNRLEPRKRTMHTLSAVIIEDGERELVLGLSGGHYRPLLHAQILTNIIDYSMPVQEAIEHPRFIWEVGTRKVVMEEGLEPSIKGFNVSIRKYPSRLGVAAAVEVKAGVRSGYCDIRGDGLPVGLP